MVDLLGYVAGILTIISFVPQVIKSWKSKSIGDLSISTGLIIMLSAVAWTAYGVALPSTPMIVTNIVVFICVLLIVLVHFAP